MPATSNAQNQSTTSPPQLVAPCALDAPPRDARRQGCRQDVSPAALKTIRRRRALERRAATLEERALARFSDGASACDNERARDALRRSTSARSLAAATARPFAAKRRAAPLKAHALVRFGDDASACDDERARGALRRSTSTRSLAPAMARELATTSARETRRAARRARARSFQRRRADARRRTR